MQPGNFCGTCGPPLGRWHDEIRTFRGQRAILPTQIGLINDCRRQKQFRTIYSDYVNRAWKTIAHVPTIVVLSIQTLGTVAPNFLPNGVVACIPFPTTRYLRP
jgi:hypothetical protein